MEIKTRDFGKIEIDKNNIIEFPRFIPGFPEEKEFILLPLNEKSPFIVMQSVKTTKVSFITLEPGSFIKDYEFEINDNIIAKMKISNKKDLLVLSILTLKNKLEDITLNLAAPLLINLEEKLGRQIILEQSKYPVRYKLFSDKKKELVK